MDLQDEFGGGGAEDGKFEVDVAPDAGFEAEQGKQPYGAAADVAADLKEDLNDVHTDTFLGQGGDFADSGVATSGHFYPGVYVFAGLAAAADPRTCCASER